MNRRKLMEDGATWEEAEDALSTYAEEQADARRDEEVTEYFQQQGESK